MAPIHEDIDTQAALMAAQLRHTIDLLRADLQALSNEITHQRELYTSHLAVLERIADDHEQRLRAVTDGVTQFKMFAGLASTGSSIASIIALLKAWLGS